MNFLQPLTKQNNRRRQLAQMESLEHRHLMTSASLIADLNPGTGSTNVGSVAAVGKTLFIAADDGSGTGQELHTQDGLLADINPGGGSSNIANLTPFNDLIAFSANNGSEGNELFFSDGTPDGTFVVDINRGAGSSNPQNLVVLGDQLIFNANDGVNGTELFVSDGTEEGTRLLTDINAGPNSSSPSEIKIFAGQAIFSADNGRDGSEPFVTDGTAAGTKQLVNLRPGVGGSNPRNFQVTTGAAFFEANDGSGSNQLFRLKGDAIDKISVGQVIGGNVDVARELLGEPIAASSLTSVEDRLFFVTTLPGIGIELGSVGESGAATILDIRPGSSSSAPEQLTPNGQSLAFTARQQGSGPVNKTLFAAGPLSFVQVTDGFGNGFEFVREIQRNGDELFFVQDSATEDPSLFRIAEGRRPTEVRIGGTFSIGATIDNLKSIGGDLVFTTRTNEAGTELHTLQLGLIDVLPGTDSGAPSQIIDANGVPLFVADNGINGRELFQVNPTVSINDSGAFEPADTTVNLNATVSLSSSSFLPVQVTARTENNTARAGEDFTQTTERIVFQPGEISQRFAVPILADGDTPLFEDRENFSITLSDPRNTVIRQGVSTSTITDQFLPKVSILDTQVFEGDRRTSQALFTLSLDKPSSVVTSVRVSTATGESTAAGSGEDFVAKQQLVNFLPGQTSRSFAVNVLGDTDFEPDEQFLVELSDPTKLVIATPQAIGTIQNDDELIPLFSVSDVEVQELDSGQRAVAFTISQHVPFETPTTVSATTNDGSAIAGQDYLAQEETFTFAPGETVKTFEVPILGDTIFERNQDFFVNLFEPENGLIADGQGRGTILDDESVPQVSIEDVSQPEGNAGVSDFVFAVNLSNPSEERIEIRVSTDNVSTSSADVRARRNQRISFAPLSTAATFAVQVNGDRSVEEDETFVVNLFDPTNAEIADNQAEGIILNDDEQPTISLSEDVLISEGNRGTSKATLTLRLSHPSDAPINARIKTTSESAVSPRDFKGLNRSIRIPKGQTEATFTVSVVGDTAIEADEAFRVELVEAPGATIERATSTVTIVNDDEVVPGLPTISIADQEVIEGDRGRKNMNFTIALSEPATENVTFFVSTENGTAIGGDDYITRSNRRVTIRKGRLSQTFRVQVIGDVENEVNETFGVRIDDATNAILGDNLATATIIDNENNPSMVSDLQLSSTITADGTEAMLTGRLVDADEDDQLTLVVDWGDGSPIETLQPGRNDFRLTHTYDGNPPGVVDGTFPIQVDWFDQLGEGNGRTLAFEVQGDLGIDDIDTLCHGILMGQTSEVFDIDGDGVVDHADYDFLLDEVMKVARGDANLDGEVDLADFLTALHAGEFADETDQNSTWAEGDWNCDGDFTISDFFLMASGRPRSDSAVAASIQANNTADDEEEEDEDEQRTPGSSKILAIHDI